MEVDEKVCPRCAETVKAAALVCKHCNHEFGTPVLPQKSPQTATPALPPPKKMNPFLGGCLGIVGIIVVLGMIGNALNPKKSGDTSSNAETALTQPPMQVTALELAQAYDANEVAAQQAYGDKTLDVTGTISGVTLDFLSDPVVQLVGVNQFLPVQASFDKSDSDRLARYSKGDQITVRCTKITEVISAPMLSDCTLP